MAKTVTLTDDELKMVQEEIEEIFEYADSNLADKGTWYDPDLPLIRESEVDRANTAKSILEKLK